MKQRVVIGLSGGVDSSVAAGLLLEQNYEVIGVTMQIWEAGRTEAGDAPGCCGLSAVEDARRVASHLGIPYYVMNFRREFRQNVVEYFLRAYLEGSTPNPCISCNRYVKWESLLHRSMEIGADFIATGHYARIERLAGGRYALARSVSRNKDQSYALYNLTQEQLARTLMPVGAYDKEHIRRLAVEWGLPVAHKPDSQEICFVPDGDYAAFIRSQRPGEPGLLPGDFVDGQGRVLGRHKGIIHYTVGQRRGLGLALGYPAYVWELRPESNQVVVGPLEGILRSRVYFDQVHWMAWEGLREGARLMAKIRYNHAGEKGYLERDGQGLCFVFDRPVKGAAKGQALVFYDGDLVAGGGVIL